MSLLEASVLLLRCVAGMSCSQVVPRSRGSCCGSSQSFGLVDLSASLAVLFALVHAKAVH